MESIKTDFRQAGLDLATLRMLEFAERVTRKAHEIEQQEVETTGLLD
ncbi:MAG: hypothetical protein ACE5IR_18620 [bacterium]